MEAGQHDQVAALQEARAAIASKRSTHIGVLQERNDAVNTARSTVATYSNRLQVLKLQKQECEKSARALTAAYVGLEMPQAIVDQQAAKADQLKGFDQEIARMEEAVRTLEERREIAELQYGKAQHTLGEFDEQIRLVDQRIAEIRGF